MGKNIVFASHRIKFRLRNQQKLIRWINSVIKNEKSAAGEISIVFCSDNYLLRLNRDFLNHDYYTDIITFSETGNKLSGEIYISIDRIKENSKTFAVPFTQELNRVIIHGVLHLLGYNDKLPEEKRQMTNKENWCLSLLNVSRGTLGKPRR
jgi:probable rRNA maturation factor